MIPLKELKRKAKDMKKYPTPSEKMGYALLDQARINYIDQQIFGFYILDILIPNRLLIVEVDGPYHIKGNEHDRKRDEYCKERGLKVLRIKNESVVDIVRKVKKYPKIKGYQKKVNKILKDAAREQSNYEREYRRKYGKR